MNPAPNVQPSPRLPKATLLSLITTLSGVQVRWTTDPAAGFLPGMEPGKERAWIDLSISSIVAVGGADDTRRAYNPATDQNDVQQVGVRRFTMGLLAKSLDATLEAYDLCHRIEFKLRTAAAEAIFVPALLSINSIAPISVFTQRTTDIGGAKRALLVASMDVIWNWTAYADPLNPGEGNYIKTVDGGGVIPVTLS